MNPLKAFLPFCFPQNCRILWLLVHVRNYIFIINNNALVFNPTEFLNPNIKQLHIISLQMFLQFDTAGLFLQRCTDPAAGGHTR